MNRISICITVYNEEKDISSLLDSILIQVKKPDEIVIVDGGSKDRTVEIIRHYQKKDKRIRLLIEKGSPAHGRNVAIDIAKGDVIAQIDAGCTAKNDWLKKITNPFKNSEVDLVAGFYLMKASNQIQEVVNVYHGVPPERFNPQEFMPSARSVAFRKKVWEEVGGYSEKLHKAGEDTLFFYDVVKAGFNVYREKEAIVYWNESANMNFKTSIKKFYQYALGDAEAGIWWHPSQRAATHNIKISAVFVRYFLGLFIFILAFKYPPLFLLIFFLFDFYMFWSIWKWRDVIKGSTRFYIPIVQVISDFAVMFGFSRGLFLRRS